MLKCVICPGAGFKKWETFNRHCEQSEVHPVSLDFCRFCGVFFARSDAWERHEEKPPETCTVVSPAEVEVKRGMALEVLEGFERDLDAHLRFGRDLGEPLVQRLMRLFPNSSKRGGREQNRLKS